MDGNDLIKAHDDALAATGRLVAGVGEEQWHNPTPCDDWDVHELVNHIVSGNLWAGELATGSTIESVGDRLEGDQLGDDPVSAYQASALSAGAAFKGAGRLAEPALVSYGPVPNEVYLGHRFIDVLIHGWDLAVGTGQSTALDETLVRLCWEVVEPQQEVLSGSGAFGVDHTIPEGADLQTRLLAVLGRQAV